MFGPIGSDSSSYVLKQAASNLDLLGNPPLSCTTDVSGADSAECAINMIASTGPSVKTSSKHNMKTGKHASESRSFSLCFHFHQKNEIRLFAHGFNQTASNK